jgi:hypothetical protein
VKTDVDEVRGDFRNGHFKSLAEERSKEVMK